MYNKLDARLPRMVLEQKHGRLERSSERGDEHVLEVQTVDVFSVHAALQLSEMVEGRVDF